jgi:rhamnosyltransferase
MNSVTVLIRTKNNDWVLRQTLQSLFSQTIKPSIVVVDSGSTDTTLEILKEWEIIPKKIAPEKYIPGKVINEAVQEIDSEIIIMLNSDSVLLTSNALEILIKPLIKKQNVIATVGRQIPRHDSEPWVKKDYSHAFPEQSPLPDYIHLSFPLSAFRRSAWEKEKLYLKSWGSEDSEWGKRLKDKKIGKIEYVPEAITMHSHNYTFKQLFARKFIEGEADFFIYNKRASIKNMILGALKRSVGEIIYYIKNKHLLQVFKIPFRNIVYFYGEYRGLVSAQTRAKKNDDQLAFKSYQ